MNEGLFPQSGEEPFFVMSYEQLMGAPVDLKQQSGERQPVRRCYALCFYIFTFYIFTKSPS